jgi:hypothetical protein
MLAAYGLRFAHPLTGGLDDPPDSWPFVGFTRVSDTGYPAAEPLVLGDALAAMRFREGWLQVVNGEPPQIRCAASTLSDDALVHPYLSLPAAVINHWMGGLSLHAGAIVARSGAVVVTALKEGGKSTTMAAAAAAGLAVLTDDLLVIRGDAAMAGPRSVDLRPEAARQLGGRNLGLIGGRERWRLTLPQIAAEHHVTTVVELAWGHDVELLPVTPVERLDLLSSAAALGPQATSPERLLDVLALPTFRLTRPRRLDCLSDVLDVLASL